MNLLQIWKSLAPNATDILSAKDATEPCSNKLEGIAQTLGCHVLLHRVSDMLPCFVSASFDRFFRMCNGKLCSAEMLQFIGRQRYPIIPFWNGIVEELGNSFDEPQLMSICLTDLNGKNVWCAGCYGLLPTPYDHTPVVMGICYELATLGPIGMLQANEPQHENALQQRFNLLSEREREVLALILSEKSVSGIAKELFLCVDTVSSHRKNLMAKLQVRSNIGMVAYQKFLFK
jgi:DNA-binding CsgD family transcriptional regulator